MSKDLVSSMGLTPPVHLDFGHQPDWLESLHAQIKTAKTEEDFQASVGVPTRARVSLQRKLTSII
jgi:hypothetical protein